MIMKCIFLCFALMKYTLSVSGQKVDLNEFAATLNNTDIPVRVASLSFNGEINPFGDTRRIIGGDVATPHEYPYQVALYIYVYITLYFCGGTLITPQWVLTAAHCIEHATAIIVVLGTHDLNAIEESRVAYNSSTYIVHEDWNYPTFQYDVAVIRLPENVTLNNYINTVPIAYGTDSYAGEIGRCLGWGRTSSGSYSDVLKYVDAEVITNEKCSSYEVYEPYIVDQHLCTSGIGFVGSCNQDSGGALIVDGIQIGIVSWGVTNCSAGLPSVYVRLTDFYTWVNETIENFNKTNNGNANRMGPLFSIYAGVGLTIVIANYL